MYDGTAQHTEIGLAFIREEIARRDAVEQTATIGRLSRQMRDMTIVILVLTAINALSTLVLFLR